MITQKFRILALGGGGIKGAFTAAVLAAWEEDTGARIAEHFDLITGTSTGGILAVGLGIGLSAAQMLEFYKTRGPHIFPVTGFGRKLTLALRQVIQPKYSGDVLRRELVRAFGEKKFGESTVRLVIPTYDTLRGRIFVFKTRHDARFKHDLKILAADIALATAAAPTYFKAARIPAHADQGYVDGGVWANCPAMVGVVEAVSFLGKSLTDLDVLSVGTTYAPDSVRDLAGAGLAGWGARAVSLIMNAQDEAAHKQAMLLVGRERFLRVDCVTKPGEYGLDSSDEVNELAGLGRSKAVEKDVLDPVKARFLNGEKAEPFRPAV